jgi:hypothetical protein
MTASNYVALVISASALVVSIYGVAERRRDARRAERVRLTTIIADLDALYVEQLKTPDGLSSGDLTSAINSRREVLSLQALALLPRFEKEITSSELRVLAFALSRAGWKRSVRRKAGFLSPAYTSLAGLRTSRPAGSMPIGDAASRAGNVHNFPVDRSRPCERLWLPRLIVRRGVKVVRYQ